MMTQKDIDALNALKEKISATPKDAGGLDVSQNIQRATIMIGQLTTELTALMRLTTFK